MPAYHILGISFINVRFHHKEDQAPEVIKLLTMYIMENSRLVVHQPMDTSCIVFNMEGFTLSNMVTLMQNACCDTMCVLNVYTLGL